jgi:transcriptional regulator with XRE-family HTH domain
MLYSQRYESVRQILRETRKQADLTQIELAEKLGRGQSYVSKVERGEQYVDLIEFLEWCEACKTPPSKVVAKI